MKRPSDSRTPRRRRGAAPPGADPYRVVSALPPAPVLPGEVKVAEDLDRVIDLLAADLVVHAENCVRTFGDFHLALSGGSTPEPLYRRLMYDPNYRRLPWRRTHLWIVDERCVPFDDEQSNFRMIRDLIADHADIPAEQVHPVFALSDTAAEEYERQLRESLAWREKGHDRLDFVLLGMGADGHTASLFPEADALDERDHLVRSITHAAAMPPRRVTMTYPIINAARFIAVLVSGSSKARTIERIATGPETFRELPIKGINPINGELKWYLDAAACSASYGGLGSSNGADEEGH